MAGKAQNWKTERPVAASASVLRTAAVALQVRKFYLRIENLRFCLVAVKIRELELELHEFAYLLRN